MMDAAFVALRKRRRRRRCSVLWVMMPSMISAAAGWWFLFPSSLDSTMMRNSLTTCGGTSSSSSDGVSESSNFNNKNCKDFEKSDNNKSATHVTLFMPPIVMRCCCCCLFNDDTDKTCNWNCNNNIPHVVFSLTALAAELIKREHHVLIIGTYYHWNVDNFSSCCSDQKKKHDEDTISTSLAQFLKSMIIRSSSSDLLDIKLAPLQLLSPYDNGSSSCHQILLENYANYNYNSYKSSPSTFLSPATVCETLPVYQAMKELLMLIIMPTSAMDTVVVTPHDLLGGILLVEKLALPSVVLASSSFKSLSLVLPNMETTTTTTTTDEQYQQHADTNNNDILLRKLQTTTPGTGLRIPINMWERTQNFFFQRHWNFRTSLSYVHVNKIRKKLGLKLWKSLQSYYNHVSAIILDAPIILPLFPKSETIVHEQPLTTTSTTHVHLTGPWLHSSNNDMIRSMLSSIMSLTTTTNNSDNNTIPIILITDLLERHPQLSSSSRSNNKNAIILKNIVRGITFAKSTIQSYANKVCQQAIVPADDDDDNDDNAYLKNLISLECQTLQQMSKFHVIWSADDDCCDDYLPSILPSYFHVISSGIQKKITPEQILHYYYSHQHANKNDENEETPMQTTLPPVLAAISSCSSRTVHAFLSHGVPNLCLPTTPEQLDVAAFVMDRNCGLAFSPSGKKTTSTIHSNHVRDLLVELLIGRSTAQCYSIMNSFEEISLSKLLQHYKKKKNIHYALIVETSNLTTITTTTKRYYNNDSDAGIFINNKYQQSAKFTSKQPIFDKAHGVSKAIQIIQSVVKKNTDDNSSDAQKNRFSSGSGATTTWFVQKTKTKKAETKRRPASLLHRGWYLYLLGIATVVLSCSFLVLLCLVF